MKRNTTTLTILILALGLLSAAMGGFFFAANTSEAQNQPQPQWQVYPGPGWSQNPASGNRGNYFPQSGAGGNYFPPQGSPWENVPPRGPQWGPPPTDGPSSQTQCLAPGDCPPHQSGRQSRQGQPQQDRTPPPRFEEMDTNGDEKLSPEEAQAIIKHMDSDGDGFLTWQEMPPPPHQQRGPGPRVAQKGGPQFGPPRHSQWGQQGGTGGYGGPPQQFQGQQSFPGGTGPGGPGFQGGGFRR